MRRHETLFTEGDTSMTQFTINGSPVELNTDPESTLLWVLHEQLDLPGTRFGCGQGLCGACTIHIDGVAAFSCQTLLEDVEGKKVTTIEGLSPEGDHPVQRAWVEEQTPQCGYCQSGQIMRAAALLSENPSPTRDEIISGMSTNLCRCGTYPRIVRAVERAAVENK